MSRIGKNPVPVPKNVEITLNGQEIRVKGKLGELTMHIYDGVAASIEKAPEGANDDVAQLIAVKPKSTSKQDVAMWATSRTLIKNLIDGVCEGFSKTLEINGIGYRAQLQGNTLNLQLGYSHDVKYTVPSGIKVEMDGQTKVKISGIDKQQVGQVAAEIKSFRPPEPYKGKGIKYEGEYILRKEGKKK